MTSRTLRALAFAGAAAASLAAAPARAYQMSERVTVYGYAQVWAVLWEQMEAQKGLVQFPSGDHAADALSGFSLARARLGVRFAQPDWHLSLLVQARFDHDPALLDADVAWSPRRWFALHLGQFKIPGTYEALQSTPRLDFILRTDITTALADYSLSKAQDTASLLYGSLSYLRDLGVAVKGEVGGAALTARYFFMIGNGLGANTYFGGLTKKEYFITNRAQLYYGARLELSALKLATVGLFGSYNRHDNIVYNSGRAIFDIDRRSLGGDLQVLVPRAGLRLGALGGGGQVRDDFDGDGKIDLRYSGWSVSAVWDLFAALRSSGRTLPERHALELAGRFERFDQEVNESGLQRRREQKTLGLNYVAASFFKVQLEYVWRRSEDPTAPLPNLANNVLFAQVQAAF